MKYFAALVSTLIVLASSLPQDAVGQKKFPHCGTVSKGVECTTAGDGSSISPDKALLSCQDGFDLCKTKGFPDCLSKLSRCTEKVNDGDRSPLGASETYGFPVTSNDKMPRKLSDPAADPMAPPLPKVPDAPDRSELKIQLARTREPVQLPEDPKLPDPPKLSEVETNNASVPEKEPEPPKQNETLPDQGKDEQVCLLWSVVPAAQNGTVDATKEIVQPDNVPSGFACNLWISTRSEF